MLLNRKDMNLNDINDPEQDSFLTDFILYH